MATNVGNYRSTAGDIINQVGVEIGLDPEPDPFASSDQTYRQMTYLINTVGKELTYLHPWQNLRLEQYIDTTTPVGTSGNSAYYDLPADILYYTNGTGWDSNQNRPLRGPATPQEWAYLQYAGFNKVAGDYTFEIKNDYIYITPDPNGAQLDLYLTYQSRNWVFDASAGGTTRRADCQESADTPAYDSLLIGRYLKLKILEARGFDTSKAQADFNQVYQMCIARDAGAPTLSAGRTGRQFSPYLLNTPETGYGS